MLDLIAEPSRAAFILFLGGVIIKTDLTGRQYGMLKVKCKTNRKHPVKKKDFVWECICDCGKTCYLPTSYLNSGDYKSCGCNRGNKDIKTLCMVNIIEHTNIKVIAKKTPNKNNKSGIRGVYWASCQQKWCACIDFKKKRYNLGYYSDITQATAARKNAEENLHDKFLEWYKNERKTDKK